jgi:hypothetical protein
MLTDNCSSTSASVRAGFALPDALQSEAIEQNLAKLFGRIDVKRKPAPQNLVGQFPICLLMVWTFFAAGLYRAIPRRIPCGPDRHQRHFQGFK